MKTIFKSLLYFSFAGLILTGCAKNDDFSVPSVECENKDIAANKEIGEIYALTDQNLKKYEEDHIISGTVISSDRGGNFYREIYFVSDDNKFSGVFKADIKGSYARYELGSQIFIKLKDVHVQQNNGVLAIGARDTDPSKNFISYLADPTYKKFIVKGCNRISPEEVTKKFATELTLKEAATDANIGKLVTLKDVQFTADVRGKLFWSKDRPAPGNATLNEIEGKDGNPTAKVVFRVVEQSSDFAGKTIPNNSGRMTGVMTKFGTGANLVYQFVPRFWEDLDLKQDPFEGAVTTPNEGADVDGVNQNKPSFIADFTNWETFIKSTNKFGLMPYAKEAPGQGKDGKGAIAIKGNPAGNDYLFTIENQAAVKNAKSITMWVKGTSSKSLSFNVYRANGTYAVFNLSTDERITNKEKKEITSDLVMQATKRVQDNNKENGQNDYIYSTINAQNWIKLTLDLTDVDYNTSGKGSLFAFKVGSAQPYDLLVSDIVFEGGEGGETPTDPETPGEVENLENLVFFGSDFNDWKDFDLASYNDKLKEDATMSKQGIKNGRNGENALIINGELTKGNPYIFSSKNIKGKAIAKNKTKIVFWIKGKTTNKSLSINVYGPDELSQPNQHGDKFAAFNVGSVADSDVIIEGTKGNSYAGTIDTKGKWVKVTLDLASMNGTYNTEVDKPIISLKIGGTTIWDNFLVSGFTFE